MLFYAVVDVDPCCREDYNDYVLMHALTRRLYKKRDKLKQKRGETSLNNNDDEVVVVGLSTKKDSYKVSIVLERTLAALNLIATQGFFYKNYILLDKQKRGKAIPLSGEKPFYLSSPPEDITGVPVFLTRRPCVKKIFNHKASWWGSTGKLGAGMRRWRTHTP